MHLKCESNGLGARRIAKSVFHQVDELRARVVARSYGNIAMDCSRCVDVEK